MSALEGLYEVLVAVEFQMSGFAHRCLHGLTNSHGLLFNLTAVGGP